MPRCLVAAALLSAGCAHRQAPASRTGAPRPWNSSAPEAFADAESALSGAPRCRPRRYWTKEQSRREQLVVEAKGQHCPGPPTAVLGLGTLGPPSSEALAALSRAVGANGVPCKLRSHGDARKALQNTTVIVLGDSTILEDWHYLTWMLYPDSVAGQPALAWPWFNVAPQMPTGMAPLLGRRLPDDPDGPGLGESPCWTIDDPNGPEVRVAFCPNHRRAEAVLRGPGGRAEAALVSRFTGHHLISDNHLGIDSYFQPQVRKEWSRIMQRAVRRGHKVVIIIGTGAHDVGMLKRAYQLGLKNGTDPTDGVPMLELALARFRVQMERLADRLARFQIAGAHVIWRGCNHGQGQPGAVPGTQHPASQYSILRRVDRAAREAFDTHLRPFGAHFLNATEITRVYYGDGGWNPSTGFFMDQRPWQLPFLGGIHVGARQRYRIEASRKMGNTMEINGLMAQALLSLVGHGCPGAPRDAA